MTFDQIPDSCAHKRVMRKYIEDSRANLCAGAGLLFYGEPDFGKTSSAIIIGKAALLEGFSVLFLPVDQIQSAIITKEPFDEEQSLISRARSCDLLILDDLGLESSKEFGKSAIEGLIRYRSNRRLSTIITMNLTPKKLDSIYGRAMKSVMTESIYPVPVDGKNWRKQQMDELKSKFR